MLICKTFSKSFLQSEKGSANARLILLALHRLTETDREELKRCFIMKPPMQVVVCGSMQFASKFVALQQRLAELGHKAYIPTPKIDQRAHPAAGDEQANSLHMKRRQVMLAHFAQIEQADVILVANYEKN